MKYLILLLAFATTACAQRTPIVPDYEIGEELTVLDSVMTLKYDFSNIDTFLTTGYFTGYPKDSLSRRLEGLNPALTSWFVGESCLVTGATNHNEYTTKCDTFLTIAVEYTWGPPSRQEQPKVISLYETRCRKHYTGTTLRFGNDWPTYTYYNLDFTPFVEDKDKFYMYMSKLINHD